MSGGASIHVEGVWKRFLRGQRTDNIRDLVPALVKGMLGRGGSGREAFWAVRDVSFTVEPGQALGIIGPNGAGKSTVLKLLNGILHPERGTIAIRGTSGRRGRIGALIELAAGFHSELTGRENIFLQGAIMGMDRRSIREKFDEIVAFSELETFIDTPVKRFSSGMQARLGFAIAAHLDPDVLLIDEILAVGDHAFQQKAFGRLRALVDQGIPTVVVSHQLGRVAGLCDRGLLLGDGEARHEGPAGEVVAAYLSGETRDPVVADPPVELHRMTTATPCVSPGERILFRVYGAVVDGSATGRLRLGVRVRTLPSYEPIFTARTEEVPGPGPVAMEVDLQMNVGPGSYHVQPVAWLGRLKKEVALGPYVLVDVVGDGRDPDRAYLNPRIQVVPAGERHPA